MRFLIARLSSLGDVVCCLPVAGTLKAAFPNSEITWAVDPRFAGIVECCTAVDTVVRTKPKFNPSSWPRFEGAFDAALDLQGLSKSAIVVARANARLKLGYHWQREGAWLFSHPVAPDPSSIHVVDQYVDVARAACDKLGEGADSAVTAETFSLRPNPVDVEAIQERLNERGVQGKYALINPGAGWITKRWPPAHFGAVVDWLWEHEVAPVALGGNAAEDHATFDEVATCSNRPPIKMTGATNVRELVALTAGATAHIGGDTGSSHLAAALGIPAIGLYSITRPERSCPYGQVERCLYSRTGLSEIPPAAVFDAFQRL